MGLCADRGGAFFARLYTFWARRHLAQKLEMDRVPNSAWEDIRRFVVPKERRHLWSVLLREKTQATRQAPLFLIDSIVKYVFHEKKGNDSPRTTLARNLT